MLLTVATVSMGFQIDDWILERNKKGIRVFTKKSRWGKLRDSKAEMLVTNTSVEDLVKLLTDFDNYPNWLPRCRAAKVVARLSDSEFIGYMIFKAPWPIADRDCAVRVKVERDASTGRVTIRETSEPHYVSKHSDIVRIEQISGLWVLTPMADGVRVSNENSSNPGGGIPEWLTNTQAVENPYDIFTTLQSVIPSATGKGKVIKSR
jgi:ribosome-associated toxin RatA of RatAB toxin-antitoxin module